MTLTENSFQKMVKTRAKKHMAESFKYFWASFAMQILVYALLGHVIVRGWGDGLLMLPALIGIILYIPFTTVLMSRFKKMAVASDSINTYVLNRYNLLEDFYKFKKRYEFILIPVATLIGTFLVFELYVPGGVWAYTNGAWITFLVSLTSCIIAIREENKKSFDIPLSKLKMILDDLKSGY